MLLRPVIPVEAFAILVANKA